MLKKPVEPKLSSGQINLMIQSILIHMDHFEILAAKIKPNLFLQSEAHYALLFDIVSKHVLESDLPPSIGDFIGALDAAPDKQVAESAKRIAIAAFSAQPSSHLTKKTFQLYAVRFAKERLLLSAQHKLTEVNNSAGITNDIFDYFSNDFITTAEYIETDSQINDDTFVPFQEGWNDKALFNRIPSGVEFIDYFTDGGWIKGLTYSLMGPFGSFKSTLARQLAVNLSRTYQALFDSGQDDRLGKVFYVCGEEGKSRVMMKILSYASNIPYFKLSEGQELSTIKNPSLRDISLNQTAGYISGEIERKEQSEASLKRNLRLIDMTKSESIGSTHPITHIKNSIKRALDHDAERGLKTYCGGVFIDYLGILMESYANQVGIRQEHYYMCLRNSIQVINKTIAQPHNCITLIVHQLSGKANSFEPGIIADHSHGAGNRSFGENVDFCFQGSKVDNNGLGVFGCTKHREAAPKHPVVIRICGDTCRLEQAQGYKLDSKNHIVIGT